MIRQLKSYQNGVHGPFFLSVAAELERLQAENQQMRTDTIETTECITALRSAIRQMKVRSIINSRSVLIFGGIETIINSVRSMETLPITAINDIDALLDVIKKEAENNVITS